MAYLFTFVLTIFVVTNTLASVDPDKAKLAIMKKECLDTARAIRNIDSSTYQSKVQLASMANELNVAINYGIYSMNNAIPNAINETFYKDIAWIPKMMSVAVTTIQDAISENSDDLKETLAKILEGFRDATIKFFNEYKGSNDFIENQTKRKHDISLYILYRIKYQALLFNKTNKEIGEETHKSVKQFVDEVNSIKTSNAVTESELRHALQHLAVITSKVVYKLENWVEVNQNSTENSKLIQEVSAFYNRLHKEKEDANELYKTEYLKKRLIWVYENCAKSIGKLSEMEYPDNTGGTEYIRSSLFDLLAYGLAYAENLKAVLAEA